MKVSVIVPVFNAEKYLSRCIDSILSQSFTNLEIILIDDGSTDGSLKICKKYKKLDERVHILTKTNGGVSSARNAGLDYMNGDFVVFIDSDDYVENNMIEILIDDCLRNKAGISMCGVIKEFSDGNRINRDSDEKSVIYMREEAIYDILDSKKFHGYIGNKMFSRHIINAEDSLRFDETIHVCEDLLFCIKAFFKSDKIIFNPKQLYHYVFHDANSSQKYSERKLTALNAYQEIFKLMNKEHFPISSKFKSSYNKLVISFIIMNLNSSSPNKKQTNTLLQNELSRFRLIDLININIIIISLIAKSIPKILLLLQKLR